MAIPRVWVAIYCVASCGHTDITLLCQGLVKDNTNSAMANHIKAMVCTAKATRKETMHLWWWDWGATNFKCVMNFVFMRDM